jgi:hypothetical protein
MFRPWHCTMQVTPSVARLLVRESNRDLLKAQFQPQSSHPRALLTLLEGLSLWQGAPIRVALSVDEGFLAEHGSTLFGNELWPSESQLVRFDVVHHVRPERLGCVGDFRFVRKMAREMGS